MNEIDRLLKAIASTKGRFYDFEYKVLENSQGFFKIKIKDHSGWRFILDEDLMMAIVGSHVSKDQLFFTPAEVNTFIDEQIKLNPVDEISNYETPKVEDDFQEIIQWR